jgi:hypothetical protein
MGDWSSPLSPWSGARSPPIGRGLVEGPRPMAPESTGNEVPRNSLPFRVRQFGRSMVSGSDDHASVQMKLIGSYTARIGRATDQPLA